MLTEENPEAFASPEQKPEDGSKNKRKNKRQKKKKKNTENSAQPNEHPHPQVSSEPLVVVSPNPEIKSNEESSLPKKKNPRRKKRRINAEVAQPNREEAKPSLDLEIRKEAKRSLDLEIRKEAKPSLDLEIRKEAQPVGVSVKGAETVTCARKQESEIGKLNEVVVVENALKHDHDLEQLNTVDAEEKTGKKRKRKRNKSELDGLQSSEQNIKPGETAVRTSIIDREIPPADPTIPGSTRPVNLSELENEYLGRIWMKRKRKCELKTKEKSKEHNGKKIEIQVQRPVDPMTKPSTDLTVVMDPHPTTPIDAAVPEQKTSKKKKKRESGLKSKALESGSTAETPAQGAKRVKVTNAPYYQHCESSMICWACRETNHTMQRCQKLKYLSKDEEICFFCGEIGHSLGKCSVYKAGGGRLARCLFCDAHGHFSYNCPGNGHDPKVQWPVEAERKVLC